MPELPDITAYLDALAPRVLDQRLTAIKLLHPFVLRSVDPPIDAIVGTRVVALRRIGKRIVLCFEDDRCLMIHLMIAGRLRWLPAGKRVRGKLGLAWLEFASGVLWLTEAGSTRRASLTLVQGEAALASLDPGGIDVLAASLDGFATRLRSEGHTIKRALTDPHLFSGIGNAYSDEILHRARMSPFARTTSLSSEEVARLHVAVRATLTEWIARLRAQTGEGFPEKVTAFRPEMAVHGKAGEPCPVCGAPVQRIVYATNETNYCARCQTGGKRLADRALSRLLGEDWPREMEDG